jgi:hypothetical protein
MPELTRVDDGDDGTGVNDCGGKARILGKWGIVEQRLKETSRPLSGPAQLVLY